MASNRSHFRNVHFIDATMDSEDHVLGGLIQNGSIAEANFRDMLKILLVTDGFPIRVEHRAQNCDAISDHIVSRIDDRLEVGLYDVYCDGGC
jgi:hypothetical protein